MPVTAAASGLSYIQATWLQRTGRVGWSRQLLAAARMGQFADLKHLRLPSGTVDSALKIGSPQ